VAAFNRSLPFSELETLTILRPYIKASLKYEDCYVVSVKEADEVIGAEGEKEGWSKERSEASEPGNPAVQFWNISAPIHL
jgi:leucyl-tRNA synthetase